MTLTAMPIGHHKRALPYPLCTPWRHPLRWLKNTLQQVTYIGLFSYVGALIIVALYYLLFEVNGHMTTWWHEAVSNSTYRHNIRNVGEGLLGGLLAQQVIWNHYKKKVEKRMAKPPNLLDKIEIMLHIPNVKDGKEFSLGQLLATPVLVVIYAIPGFLIGLWIVGLFHPHVAVLPAHATLADKTQATFTQDWPKKLVGFGAAFFWGRRPAKGVFDDLQLLFVERRLANGQDVRWYHPPAFKARYNEVKNDPQHVYTRQSKWMKRITIAVIPIALALAIFGWYVLSYIA